MPTTRLGRELTVAGDVAHASAKWPPGKLLSRIVLPLSRVCASPIRFFSTGVSRIIGANDSFDHASAFFCSSHM